MPGSMPNNEPKSRHPVSGPTCRRIPVFPLDPFVQLVKAPLCLGVATSAVFGAILHTPRLSLELILTGGAVFLLACGAAGWNSIQERELDPLLNRTKDRPLAKGRISLPQAAGLSTLLLVIGLALLLALGGLPCLLLGSAALLFYNALYTPLKQHSPFALIPGGLAGALPPLIGWIAAGGSLMAPQAMLLFGLFFLWQIPHYCLLLLAHQGEYRQSSQPSLVLRLSEHSLKRIILVWTLACIVTVLGLPLAGRLGTPSRIALVAMAAGMLGCLAPLVFRHHPTGYRRVFQRFNLTLFAGLLLISVLQICLVR